MFAAPILLHVGPTICWRVLSLPGATHTLKENLFSIPQKPLAVHSSPISNEGLWPSFSFHRRMSVAYLGQVFFDQPQLLWVRQCRGPVQTLVSQTYDLTILLPSLKHCYLSLGEGVPFVSEKSTDNTLHFHHLCISEPIIVHCTKKFL